MNLQWSHVALNCRDQQVTEDFYRRWFGFERARVVKLGDQEIIFLRSGSVLLELFQADDPQAATPRHVADGPHRLGIARHLAFQTESVDDFLALLGDRVQPTLGPLNFDDYIPGWRSVWFSDPDGVTVEVSQGYRDQVEVCTHG